MLEHNSHHAEELAELASKLGEAGKTAASEHISKAVSLFSEGNKELAQALEAIKE